MAEIKIEREIPLQPACSMSSAESGTALTNREGCTGKCSTCPHRGTCKLCASLLHDAQGKEDDHGN
jgi:hypothetical protein